MSEGGVVSPRDIIRLNALALKITHGPDCELNTLPRFASFGGVSFREPDIAHEIFLDECDRMFSGDDATYTAVQAWVMSHPADELLDEYLTKPEKLLKTIDRWIREKFQNETFNQLARVVFYVRYGCDPETHEFPYYEIDENADVGEDRIGHDKSWALNHYLESAALGIADAAALRSTSAQLAAMIERAYLVRGMPLKDNEKRLTGQYYKTLDEIRKKTFEK